MAIIENKAIDIINSTGRTQIDPSTIQLIITVIYYLYKLYKLWKNDTYENFTKIGPVERMAIRWVCARHGASEWAEPIMNSIKNTSENDYKDLIFALSNVK